MDSLSDLTFLRTFTGGDPEKMKKYINLFLNGAEPALEAINKNVASADWPAVRTAAHSLKSQVKYMGIKKAEELAFSIEQNAGSGSHLDQIPQNAAQLAEITRAACSELRTVLSTL